MTDLRDVLARMLLNVMPVPPGKTAFPLIEGEADEVAFAMLDSIEGSALAALVEAALAWADSWGVAVPPDATDYDLYVATKSYREATR